MPKSMKLVSVQVGNIDWWLKWCRRVVISMMVVPGYPKKPERCWSTMGMGLAEAHQT